MEQGKGVVTRKRNVSYYLKHKERGKRDWNRKKNLRRRGEEKGDAVGRKRGRLERKPRVLSGENR